MSNPKNKGDRQAKLERVTVLHGVISIGHGGWSWLDMVGYIICGES